MVHITLRRKIISVYRTEIRLGKVASLVYTVHRGVTKEVRRQGMRLIEYLDDFLIAPTLTGVVTTQADCKVARTVLEQLPKQLGLPRLPRKGEWEGSCKPNHPGFEIDSCAMLLRVSQHIAENVQVLDRDFLRQARAGLRRVGHHILAHLCFFCVSLSLQMTWERLYTRDLYWDL